MENLSTADFKTLVGTFTDEEKERYKNFKGSKEKVLAKVMDDNVNLEMMIYIIANALELEVETNEDKTKFKLVCKNSEWECSKEFAMDLIRYGEDARQLAEAKNKEMMEANGTGQA